MVCSPLASAEAVLSPRQKELGVLLIDIGAGTTGFCIFKEGVLIDVGIIPIGSFHITKDIATGLRTDIDTAERIKLQFGSCFLKGAKRFKIKEVSSGEPLVFSHSQLGKIIDARVSEIFQQIQKQAKKDSCSKLPGGAVLCGGGARLPKIKEFSKQALKMTSRLGKITGFSLKQDDSEWACASGLVLEGRKIMGDGGGPIQGVLEKLKRALKNFVP